MSKLRLAGLVVGGAGVLLLGTGVYFGVAASSAASDVEGHRGEWDQSATDLYDRGERDELLFFVLGGAGLAAIGGGAALYFLGGDAETQVAGVPAPGGGVVTVRGTF